MAITLTLVLYGAGGVLERTELKFMDYVDTVQCNNAMQARIQSVIGGWLLRPGDTIKILGNDEAFDKL